MMKILIVTKNLNDIWGYKGNVVTVQYTSFARIFVENPELYMQKSH